MSEVVIKNIPCFDPGQIMRSGQIFRMYEPEDGIFVVYSGDRRLRLSESRDQVIFYCDESEFEGYWRRYFDLDRDYSTLVERVVSGDDPFVAAACQRSCGIRILDQDLWEMLISFIISQQKQIPSIRRCIEALCERFGSAVQEDSARVWYTFPTAESIAEKGPDGLKGLSLGYRERYIYETAVRYLKLRESLTACHLPDVQDAAGLDGIIKQKVQNMGLKDALTFLKAFSGVGDKVANCVALFGAGYVDAFPIDTHIKDILYREYYLREFETRAGKNSSSALPVRKDQKALTGSDYEMLVNKYFSRYDGYRGIVQQWIFAAEL